MHQKSGRHSDALRCYDRALLVCPTNADALVGRGSLHTTRASYEDAIADLQHALKLAPDHRNARSYLEITLLRRGQWRENSKNKVIDAVTDYTAAAKLGGPKREVCREHLNRIEKMLKEKEAASRTMQASVRAAFGGPVDVMGSSPAPALNTHSALNMAEKHTLHSLRGILEASVEGEHSRNKSEKKKHKKRDKKHKHKQKREKKKSRKDGGRKKKRRRRSSASDSDSNGDQSSD